jgi:hypothetical protein
METSVFETRQGQEYVFHTGPWAHPVSCLMDIGGRVVIPWRQSGRGVKVTTYFQLGLGDENVHLYIHSPIRLHA